ncbi:MAG: hypothetical protein QXQ36_07180 [Sulfolobales archaeon]
MSEVKTLKKVKVYWGICPLCGKQYVSLSKTQLRSNLIYHVKSHKIKPREIETPIHEIEIDLETKEVK